MSNNKFDGNKLYEIRRSKNISQVGLAKKIKVSRQTVYKWESNQSVPDIEKVTLICKILEIEIKELIDISEVETNSNINKVEENVNNNDNKSKNNIFIKIIICLISILLVLYILFSTIKFIRLNKILNAWEEFDKIDNYYIKIHEYLVEEKNTDIVSENMFYEIYYHDGIYKYISKDRKNEKIKSIIISNYNIGKKYIIYEDSKTYSIKEIEKNEDNSKLSSNFLYLAELKNNSKFTNYLRCYNYNFNIVNNNNYEITVKDNYFEKFNEQTYLIEYEEESDGDFKKTKRYFETELNTTKYFEIDLDTYLKDYTEIK